MIIIHHTPLYRQDIDHAFPIIRCNLHLFDHTLVEDQHASFKDMCKILIKMCEIPKEMSYFLSLQPDFLLFPGALISFLLVLCCMHNKDLEVQYHLVKYYLLHYQNIPLEVKDLPLLAYYIIAALLAPLLLSFFYY